MTMPLRDTRAPAVLISRVTGSAVASTIEPLLREYGDWAAGQIERSAEIKFSDSELEQYHEAFRGELPLLLGARGRLLCARVERQVVGVGALKPIDDETAEIKRMYVRPSARGNGIGRLLLDGLVAEARSEGYRAVRLETLRFMTTARAMYLSAGFFETREFIGSQTAATPLAPLALYMTLDLS